MKWVAFLFISMLFAGCAVKNHDFPVHLEQTKRAARSYLGKPFLTYLELNPEIRSHVPDGQGGMSTRWLFRLRRRVGGLV